ncbi:MAG: hypothetical protein DYG83_09250 [Candidatus Brocadia sp. AMX2]|uniref:Uncharacterized protein n=1 Tax=Candidatus Brocadia sinica JPN1 TaxID=1197129 RepID=A0ABQ0K1D1_9BACT|nr:MAG: hypothetical protein EDM70_08245 [Candidatus Brocadia sp. AMX2]MBC6932552.1 hypothetical protein [Candidatus Brocadia sp.]MBL1168086.1 hypothetical protein [Candidatus Brocadia sp. AMX1]GAN34879.1 hypothetical protein BROSI_A3423 [Candidatus Brocadia sinica JPN1]GIK11897.1 MAG: hypothetical protein BroJett002_06040 [Candidatus Brocadia sinica]
MTFIGSNFSFFRFFSWLKYNFAHIKYYPLVHFKQNIGLIVKKSNKIVPCYPNHFSSVKELMEHKNFKMTLRYAHLAPSHKVKAVDMLDNIMTEQPSIQKVYNLREASNG